MRRYLRSRLPVLLFFLIQALPYVLFRSQIAETLGRFNFAGRRWDMNLVLAAVPFMLLVEGALLVGLAGVCKGFCEGASGTLQRIGAVIVTAVTFLLSASFYLFVSGAWYMFSLTRSFPRPEDLLLSGFLFDLKNIRSAGGVGDAYVVGGCVIIGLSMAAAYFLCTRSIRSREEFRRASRAILIPLAIVAVVSGIVRVTWSSKNLSEMNASLARAVSPQMTLFWSPLLFSTSDLGFERVELHLDPARAFELTFSDGRSGIIPKNVLIVAIEALRSDVIERKKGEPEVMPFLTSLVRKGHYFSRAYAQAPETDYGQVTILTGQYPLRFPGRDLHTDIQYPHVLIDQLLKALGYATAALTNEWQVTHQMTGRSKPDLYFDPTFGASPSALTYLEKIGVRSDELLQQSTAFGDKTKVDLLREWLTHIPKEKPFFANMFFYASHYPYENPSGLVTQHFEPAALSELVNFYQYPEHLRETMKNRYFNTLRFVDDQIGRLVEILREAGRLQDTLIVITGDHGEFFHEHGEVTHAKSLWEEELRVPLIFWGAGDAKAVVDLASPVGHVDIAPTIYELLGLSPVASVQGRALLSTDPGSKIKPPIPVFATVQTFVYEDAMISWPFKIVIDRRSGKRRVFDLERDPTEQQDISSTTVLSDRLAAELDRFRNTQLSYYALEPTERSSFLPPQHW